MGRVAFGGWIRQVGNGGDMNDRNNYIKCAAKEAVNHGRNYE